MLKRTGIVFLAFVVLQLSGCGGGEDGGSANPPVCTVSGVSVVASPATVAAGASTNLTATVTASSSCATTVTWGASPGTGGTLVAAGNTATFNGAPATYTITATSTADTTRSGSTQVVVTPVVAACGSPSGVVVPHTADIATSETWAGDGVTHVVASSIAINGSAALTIQPCAIVSLGAGATISVNNNATLLAAGTSASRQVYFRRATAGQAWGILRGTSPTSLIDLRYTVIEGAGAFGGQYRNPAIAVVGPGYALVPTAVLRVDNVTIESPVGTGVYIDTNGAFTTDSQQLTVHGAGDYALAMTMMSVGSIPGGTYTGNLINEVFVIGPNANVFANMTIRNRLPVRIQTQSMNISPGGSVPGTVTLTVEPGVTVKFAKVTPTQPGARVAFGGNGNSPLNPVGVLNAVGTASQPIVFTSGETTPAAGDWVGLWLDTANGSRLDHVEIGYAGAFSGISSNNCKATGAPDDGALIVGDFEPQFVPSADLITNSRIHHSSGHAINAIWPNASISAPNLTASNTFDNIAFCQQTYNAPTPPGTCTMRGCTAP